MDGPVFAKREAADNCHTRLCGPGPAFVTRGVRQSGRGLGGGCGVASPYSSRSNISMRSVSATPSATHSCSGGSASTAPA